MFHAYVSGCRSYMIEQLQNEVPEFLVRPESNVLTQREYEKIISFKKREHRIMFLLEVLSSKMEQQQELFIKYVTVWYPWITNYCTRIKLDETFRENMRKALDRGEVPPPPIRYVERQEQSVELLDALQSMQPNEYVVVHGMRGCGKSTLVSSVLHESPSLVLLKFQENVFWVSIHDTDVFANQLDLCSRLTTYHTTASWPADSQAAKRYLKDKFERGEMQDSLLILDDVRSASFISAFDVGCYILITTDDVSIMNKCKRRYRAFQVPEGFTEAQTLKLFSQSIESEKLPSEAKNIHDMTDGFPLTNALIAAQLAEHKEDARCNKDRWIMYVSRLKQDGIGAAIGCYDRHRSEQITLLYRAIGLGIDSLDEEFKQMYLTLALFKEDVNITHEVLRILWNKTRQDVEEIMCAFEKKNLVRTIRNSSKNTYIYCVHSLLLDYLKKLLGESEKKELHRKFIDCYQEKYGEDFNDFPVDDNYILLYLGYHLLESGMEDEFPNLYLDLKIVEKKIVYYGAADLLFDFEKYKDHIARNEEDMKKYEDFTYFIRHVAASCRPISNCNLVQFALCECEDSEVYKAALKLKSQRDPSYLVNNYFEILTPAPIENSPPSVFPDREEIVRVTFTYCGDILIANSQGIIRRMNHGKDKFYPTLTFEGHTERVSQLRVKNHSSLNFFLSASDDATVRVWNANGSSGGGGDFEARRTPSPQLKQPEWIDGFKNSRAMGEKAVAVLKHGLPVKCARFSNNPANLDIVTIDADGQLHIFSSVIDTDYNGLIPVYPPGGSGRVVQTGKTDVDSCSFSNDDSFILYSCSGGGIFIHHAVTGDLIQRLDSTFGNIESMIIVPEISEMKAVVLSESYFSTVHIKPVDESQAREFTLESRPKSSYGRRKRDHFVSAAVSWDGKYIAVATSNYSISIFDVASQEEVLKFDENNGKISSLCWSWSNDVLLTTYERGKIMKMWTVQQDGILNNSVKLRPHVFDAAWIVDVDDEEVKCIAAAVDNRNHINVFVDLLLEKKLNPTTEKISQICVCPLDGDIVYAEENGAIFLVERRTWRKKAIFDCPHRRVSTLKAFGTTVDRLRDDTVKSRTLVLVLAEGEESDNEFALSGWIRIVTKNSMATYEAKIDYNPLPPHAIRDYSVNLQNDALYVVTVDHALHVYNALSGKLKRVENLDAYKLDATLTEMKYCDISSNFAYLVTGNEKHRFVRTTKRDTLSVEWRSDTAAWTCKFSPNAKYLIVGFENGTIEVYLVESLSSVHAIEVDHSYKYCPGSVQDITWSPSSDRFMITFEREMSLYTVLNDRVELCAIIHMSADKLVSDASFSRSATVDSTGHYRVLRHPF